MEILKRGDKDDYAVEMLLIGSLSESSHNHRRRYPKGAMDEMVESIREKGIVNPLLVRPNGKNGSYEIICGSRRFRCAKEVGLGAVPAFVRNLSDKEALEVMLIDNLHREGIHPLEEAIGYRELLNKHGFDVGSIAARVAKSASYIHQRMKLLDLTKEAQGLFFEDRLTVGHAVLLARLQPDMQEKALKACNVRVKIEGKNDRFDSGVVSDWPVVTVYGLRKWIETNVHLNLKKAVFPLDDAKLDPKAGSCLACPKRTGCNPDLFEDFADKDTCTDPVCFHNKEAVFLKSRQEEAPRKLIPLSSVERIPDSDRRKLPPDLKRNYKVVKPGSCENARDGVVVYGPCVGDVKTICAATRSCKKHHPGSYLNRGSSEGASPVMPKVPTAAQLAREKKAGMERSIHAQVNAEVFRQVLEKAKEPFPRELLLDYAQSADVPESEELLAVLKKLFPASMFGGSWLKNSEVEKLKGRDLIRLVYAGFLMEYGDTGLDEDRLELMCDRCKVNRKAVEASIRKQVKAATVPVKGKKGK